jgi:hypothetical protein
MTKCVPTALLLASAFLAASLVAPLSAQQPAPSQGSYGVNRPPASDELLRAYDVLTEVAVWIKSDQSHLSDDMTKLFDQAKQYYREAHKNLSAGNEQRAVGLAMAASAAGSGLLFLLHATTPPLTDLPKPPQAFAEARSATGATPPAPGNPATPTPGPGRYGNLPPSPTEATAQTTDRTANRGPAGTPASFPERDPWQPALSALQNARSRIRDATDNASKGPGQEFLAASRKVYEQGRQAYQEHHYFKAFELAMAADAWTRVPEFLDWATNVTGPGQGPGRIPAPPPGFEERRTPVRPPQ